MIELTTTKSVKLSRPDSYTLLKEFRNHCDQALESQEHFTLGAEIQREDGTVVEIHIFGSSEPEATEKEESKTE